MSHLYDKLSNHGCAPPSESAQMAKQAGKDLGLRCPLASSLNIKYACETTKQFTSSAHAPIKILLEDSQVVFSLLAGLKRPGSFKGPQNGLIGRVICCGSLPREFAGIYQDLSVLSPSQQS